jgi:hypothetical protein
MADAYRQFLSDSDRVRNWLNEALQYNKVKGSTNGDELGRLSLAPATLCLVLVDSALKEFSSFDTVNGRANGEQFIGDNGYIAYSLQVENCEATVPVTFNISRLRCRLALALP